MTCFANNCKYKLFYNPRLKITRVKIFIKSTPKTFEPGLGQK